jgi:phosphoribosylformimino-5-aminoimidazole carboxamide ribotide isomerase
VIDLGGALEEGGNLSVVEEIIKEVSIPIQMGGGIRTIDDASYLLDMGVDKIILGTLAIQNPSTVHELSNEFGSERIIVALDSKDSQVVVRGWTEKTAQKAPELGKIMAEHGAGSILFTNVDHEGLLDGFKVQPLLELLKAVDIPVIYSGGVSTLEDVSVLNKTDVYGVVIGSALYKGALTFEDALIYGKK